MGQLVQGGQIELNPDVQLIPGSFPVEPQCSRFLLSSLAGNLGRLLGRGGPGGVLQLLPGPVALQQRRQRECGRIGRTASAAAGRGRHEGVEAEVAGEARPVGGAVPLQLVDPAVERGVGQVVVVGSLK